MCEFQGMKVEEFKLLPGSYTELGLANPSIVEERAILLRLRRVRLAPGVRNA